MVFRRAVRRLVGMDTKDTDADLNDVTDTEHDEDVKLVTTHANLRDEEDETDG
jgi:hypothetical protein